MHLLYIQFHILRHDISQFDICQTFTYRFSATFSDWTFHNKIFVIHLVQFSIFIHDISQLEIRYAFRSTFPYIKFHNWIFIIQSVPHTLTKYYTIGCVFMHSVCHSQILTVIVSLCYTFRISFGYDLTFVRCSTLYLIIFDCWYTFIIHSLYIQCTFIIR